jgi:hypothetical protein
MNWKLLVWPYVLATQLVYGQGEVPSMPSHPLEKKLTQAEKDFELAQRMFEPYYTGPLLAPGVTIPAPGHFAVQPYLFLTDTYGRYNANGRSESIDSIYTVNGTIIAFAGLTKWLGLQLVAGYSGNWQRSQSGSGWDDPSITLLFPVVQETATRMGVLIGVRESFPAGRYQRLNPNRNGLDATGTGAYRTSFFLNFAKLVWSLPTHPMRFRLSLQYKIPYHVRVHEFNSFGGGLCTNAKVRLPNSIAADFGYEFSITQKWAAALDIVYTYDQKVTFSGFPGRTADCKLAGLGGPSSQNLSLAPAIEYNIGPNSGILFGPWFTVWGRNSSQFAALVLSGYISW